MVMWIRTSTISQSLLRLSAAVNKGYDFGQMEENSGQLGVVYKIIRGGAIVFRTQYAICSVKLLEYIVFLCV